MSSSQTSHPLFYLSEAVRLTLWRVTYWLAFVLTWAILPVLQYYVESGHNDPVKRLVDALRSSARYQLILLGSGSLGLVYMIISSGLSLSSIKSLVMALSHCYALVMAIWLMGHGLVNVPRRLWTEAFPTPRLSHAYMHATKVSDTLADAQTHYADIVSEVVALAPYKDGRYVDWITDLLEDVQLGPPVSSPNRPTISVERSIINEGYLASLTHRFKRAQYRLLRYEADWQSLVRKAATAQDILDANERGKLELRFSKKYRFLSPKLTYYYYCFANPYISRGLSTICALASIVLVWSEMTHGTIVSVVNIIVSSTYGIIQQIVSSLILGYMCSAAFSSLTRIRVFNVYALVHHHSDPSSLIFYAMYACRLTVPLSYNYLTLITSRESVFENFLGKSINLTPLGKYFNDWLPRFILVPVLMTWFHLYDRIKNYLGLGLSFDEDEEDELSGGSFIEGRELVSRALSDPRFRFAVSPGNGEVPNLPILTSSTSGFVSFRPPQTTNGPSGSSGRLLGGGNLVHSSSDAESDSNAKKFFGNIGSQIQKGWSSLSGATSNAGSMLPRWSQLRNDSDSGDENLTI